MKKNDQIPQWLTWAREIQAIGQTGNEYAENQYQRERYNRLIELAAEIIATHSELNPPEIIENFKDQRGYATPKVDVRGAVFKDSKILLVKEILEVGWTLPGGWADVGDVPSQAAEREVYEEAGFKVKAANLVGVYDANRTGELILHHAYKLVFLCDLISGDAAPSHETSEVGWFDMDAIPQPFSGERTAMRHIEDAYAVYKDRQKLPVFD